MSIDDPTVRDQVAQTLRDCHITSSDFDGHEIADALAEAGLLRAEQVWLDPEPVVPRPGTGETEVDWRYITREAWTSCGDDEVMARALAARFGGTVQSRTVTAWTNA